MAVLEFACAHWMRHCGGGMSDKRIEGSRQARKASRVAPEEGSRAILLAATAELLADRNDLDFSLGEVAKRTGLSAALIPYHFGNKHGLLSALLEWSSGHHVEQLGGLVAMPLPALDKLRIHVRAIVATYMKMPYLDRLLHHLIDLSDEAEARRVSEYYVGRVVDFYRQLIDQGVREGSLRPIDPMHLYFVLLGTGDHLVARRRLLEPAVGQAGFDAGFARDFGDILYGMILNGIAVE